MFNVPLSRNNSNISNTTGHNLTRENSTQSRGGNNRPDSREDQYSTVSSESRKIGRFELTSNHSDTRQNVADHSK